MPILYFIINIFLGGIKELNSSGDNGFWRRGTSKLSEPVLIIFVLINKICCKRKQNQNIMKGCLNMPGYPNSFQIIFREISHTNEREKRTGNKLELKQNKRDWVM